MCVLNTVSLIFLTEDISSVHRLTRSSLAKESRSDKRTVHSTEERTTENTRNTKNVERVHKDVVFSLENNHEVESTGNTKRHTIRETTLTDRINDENSGSSNNWSTESDEDPRTHTKTETIFPFTTHPSRDEKKEVKNQELIRTAVEQPFFKRQTFPNRIEVNTNSVTTRNNSTSDDVVTVKKGTRNRFSDTIDIYRRCHPECKKEDGDRNCDKREHKNTEPTDVKPVTCTLNERR
jgi:hypothetical protein